MDFSGVVIIMSIVCTLILQAAFPNRRITIVIAGAVLSVTLVALTGRSTLQQMYAGIPWDVLLILLGLSLYTSILAKSNIFGVAAANASALTKGKAWIVLIGFALTMYIVSGVVNNITAICLMLPVFLVVLQSLGVSQGYLGLFMALILTSTNLGGAASPIGDFPAILLLSDSEAQMTFTKYLSNAAPACSVIVVLTISAYLIVYRIRHQVNSTALTRSVSLTVSKLLYRQVHIRWSIFIPGSLVFSMMLGLWAFAPATWNLSPDLVCLIGVSSLMAITLFCEKKEGQAQNELPLVESIVRKETDIESLLFLGGLFFMVVAAESTGVLSLLGGHLMKYTSEPLVCVSILMVVTGLSTAIFSAGPAMGAMLPIAKQIAPMFPDGMVYIGLALSVCAGSSFLLTAATSGPLTQSIVERFGFVTDNGEIGHFGFWTFLPYGILSFSIIQVSALLWVILAM